MEVKQHIDGIWYTTEYLYKGRKILIKSYPNKGMKGHVFNETGDKVDFTLRFLFVNPEHLLNKLKHKIDINFKPKSSKENV